MFARKKLMRITPRVLAVVAISATLVACSSENTSTSSGSDPSSVDASFLVFAGGIVNAPIAVADEFGYFADHGVTPEYTTAQDQASGTQAFVAGQANYMLANVDSLLLQRAQDIPSRAVIGFLNRYDGSVVCHNNSGVTGTYPEAIQQLVGKRVGIANVGGTTDTFLRWTLQGAGVSPDDVDIVQVGGAATGLAAFVAQQVDCLVTYQPLRNNIEVSEGDNLNTIVDWREGQGPPEFATWSNTTMIAIDEWIEANPATVTQVNAAITEALAFLSDPANVPEIVDRLSEDWFPGQDRAAVTAAFEAAAPLWSPDITPEGFANVVTVFNGLYPDRAQDWSYDEIVYQGE